MKPRVKQYASALYDALNNKSDNEKSLVLRRFLKLLIKNRDFGKIHLILREFEKIYLKITKLRLVEVSSASPLNQEVRREIEKILGKNIRLKEEVKPELLAGIQILCDGETFIDASAKRAILKMFGNRHT